MNLTTKVKAWLQPSELVVALRALNARHGYPDGVPLGEKVPEALQDAHYNVRRSFELPITLVIDELTGEVRLAEY